MATAQMNGPRTVKHSSPDFAPCYEINTDQDALNVYFHPDADYSERLTNHITLFHSLEGHEIVGCQIARVAELLEGRPNFTNASDDDVELSQIFWSLGSDARDERTREIFFQFAAKAAEGMTRVSAEQPWMAQAWAP